MITRYAGLMALGLLAACGTNPEERVTGGAAAGAATGAGVGALGGPVGALAGAAIGGGAGAVTGAVTTPNEVNLGRPLWNDPEVRVAGESPTRISTSGRSTTSSRSTGARSDARTREVQQALSRHGYDVGPIDGVDGPRTRQAITEWQRRNNLPATGTADSRTMASLRADGSSSATGSTMPPSGAAGGGTATPRSATPPASSLPPMTPPGTTMNREGGPAGGGGPSGTGNSPQ